MWFFWAKINHLYYFIFYIYKSLCLLSHSNQEFWPDNGFYILLDCENVLFIQNNQQVKAIFLLKLLNTTYFLLIFPDYNKNTSRIIVTIVRRFNKCEALCLNLMKKNFFMRYEKRI